MNGNFVQNITSAIQNKQSLETSIDVKLITDDWNTVIDMLDSHPEQYIYREPNKNRIDLNELHLRESVIPVVKEIISLLQSICPDKKITNIAYMGFGKHESFVRHKDTMDVLLLQAKGSINVNVDEKFKTTSFIDEKTGEKEYRSEVYSKRVNKIMMPGDVTYIPRDTYHIITPLQSRVTYSFGICDPNNMSG